VDNATTVYVRRPGVPKKWTARVVCLGKMCDLALLTVEEEAFWGADLRPLEFVDVPELQVRPAGAAAAGCGSMLGCGCCWVAACAGAAYSSGL
jgi:hypothetical protein